MKLLLVPLAGILLLSCSGCTSLAYYEKERLKDPTMSFAESPAETHFYHKCFYSREGSVGGIGTSAGGGCGCY